MLNPADAGETGVDGLFSESSYRKEDKLNLKKKKK